MQAAVLPVVSVGPSHIGGGSTDDEITSRPLMQAHVDGLGLSV